MNQVFGASSFLDGKAKTHVWILDMDSVRNQDMNSKFNEQDWNKCLIAAIKPKDFSQQKVNLGWTLVLALVRLQGH